MNTTATTSMMISMTATTVPAITAVDDEYRRKNKPIKPSALCPSD